MNNLIAEGAAQFRRRSEIDLPAKPLTELDFHSSHGDVSHASAVLKLDKDVDIALRSKQVGEHGAEKRELANPISLAEVSNELRIEVYMSGHRSAFYRARSGDRILHLG
jgi:hypothetical protein